MEKLAAGAIEVETLKHLVTLYIQDFSILYYNEELLYCALTISLGLKFDWKEFAAYMDNLYSTDNVNNHLLKII